MKCRLALVYLICLAIIMAVSVSCRSKFQKEIGDFMMAEIDTHGCFVRIFDGNIDTLSLSCVSNTMVFWFDSTECSFCEANKLNRLDGLYDMSSNNDFSIMTIFSPCMSMERETIERLSLYDLAHPVYVDLGNKIFKNNKTIPDYKVCHTFYVGNSNRPTFVGDPTNDSKLMRLFEKCVEMNSKQ